MIYTTIYQSKLGNITLASDGKSLIGLWFNDQKYYGGKILKEYEENNDLAIFNKTKEWLDLYFDKKNPTLSMLDISFNDSEFRHHVWQVLCDIPYGQTLSYKQVGEKVAKRMNKTSMSNQAIGQAIGHNPISIIVPCHRVVGSNKSLTGYAGGIDKKIELLKMEGLDLSEYVIPTKGSAL